MNNQSFAIVAYKRGDTILNPAPALEGLPAPAHGCGVSPTWGVEPIVKCMVEHSVHLARKWGQECYIAVMGENAYCLDTKSGMLFRFDDGSTLKGKWRRLAPETAGAYALGARTYIDGETYVIDDGSVPPEWLA